MPDDRWADVLLFRGVIDTDTTTRSIDVGDYREAAVDIQVRSSSGTDETLVPRILIAGVSGTWKHRRTLIDPLTEGDLTRLTAPTYEGKIRGVGIYPCIIPCAIAERMKVELVLGGTNPVFDLVIWVHLKK